ncbi:ATP synthase subunit I [Marinobacterium arenosum]|uniref:ATP synthase subunit I n=1 Tax=Marinobacterium arenosum TaxID=2862496 RepID=UPI001C974C03|nr:ATP synthase subunit I [Marinobacterium arenosum]MBY4676567.1 ATP synthase subunit I [Marinobacterium arenosum]
MGKGNRKQGVHSERMRGRIYRILLVQAGLTLLIALLLAGFDRTAGYSALLGGAIYLIPNLYFARRALRHKPGASAGQVLAEMYASEIWKMGMTALLFAAAFILVRPLSPFSLFATFILLHLVNFAALVWLNKRFQKL